MPPKKPFPLKPLKPLKPLMPFKPTKPGKPLPMKPLTEIEKETKKILQLKEEIGQNFWELGQCLLRVSDRQTYKQAGFKTFDRYLGRLGVNINRSTAYRLMDVARNFSRFIARKHDQSKLIAAIELTKATPQDDQPIDVLAYQIEIRDKAGKTTSTPFEKASVREIKLAANRIRRRNKPKPLLHKPAWHNAAKRALRKVSPRAKIEITTGPGTDPKIKLTLSGIPQSKLREALKNFAEFLPEA
ncbi:MAG: hypothetical protein JRF33_25985 [Deltaproteobacteria bacterium]|nr:hypothetical protein [Deltaproteobacteria bacterium]